MFHFIGEITGGSLQLDAVEISDARWVRAEELVDSDVLELRDREVMLQITKNVTAAKEYSLTVVHNQLNRG